MSIFGAFLKETRANDDRKFLSGINFDYLATSEINRRQSLANLLLTKKWAKLVEKLHKTLLCKPLPAVAASAVAVTT